MFFKKKETPSNVVLMHYEGLRGFKQDFPCKAFTKDKQIIFENEKGSTVSLNFTQIENIEYLPEVNFMGKYHNNAVTTSKTNAVKWFSIVSYVSSAGEKNYIAFWSVDSKGRKFFECIEKDLVPSSYSL